MALFYQFVQFQSSEAVKQITRKIFDAIDQDKNGSLSKSDNYADDLKLRTTGCSQLLMNKTTNKLSVSTSFIKDFGSLHGLSPTEVIIHLLMRRTVIEFYFDKFIIGNTER